MASIDRVREIRSKKDEERLAQQKAKNPTNVKRAKETAKKYSNPYKFNNNVTVKKTVTGEKWYSGNTPTARETYARMYTVADGDQQKMNELQSQYMQEASTRGSVFYNPYTQATNYKAIQGLAELGVDVPDKITDQWIDNMWSQYGKYSRETTTGYGPSAPTTKSTRENDIAYWVGTLLEDKDTTNLAEAQLGDMYKEVEYLTKQGYSDAEVLKRVRADFGSKYNVLNNMDNARLEGDAVRLNRKVDYMGDDTIYGMIWAARNGGSSGDYLADAAAYTLGWGNKYKPDPNSEAALDPSNYEGYAPYRGSTLHDLNMKYGVTEFNADWLEKNRGMLSDPEQANDWRKISDAVDNAEKAEAELAELDKWVEKQINRGMSAGDIADALKVLIENGGDEYGMIKVPTLKAMEAKRYEGDALAMAYGVNFTLPQYVAKASDMIAERDAAAEQAAAEKEAAEGEKWYNTIGQKISQWFTAGGVPKGDYNDLHQIKAGLDAQNKEFDSKAESVMDAEHGAMTADDMLRNYASAELGVDITGDLTDEERALVDDTVAKVEAASRMGATAADREAADAAIAVLNETAKQIAADPSRVNSYESSEAYNSVINRKPEEPREGMAELTAEPTAYTGVAEQVAQEDQAYEQAFTKMFQGGEWDFDAFKWAYGVSDNPKVVEAELVEGIMSLMRGEKPMNAFAQSWWNKFQGMTANVNPTVRRTGLSQGERDVHSQNPEQFDSRHQYGSQVYDALINNQKAYDAGAISDKAYVHNLILLSDAANEISLAADGGRATDELAAEVLGANNGEYQAVLDTVNAYCDEGVNLLEQEQQKAREATIGIVERYKRGDELDMQGMAVISQIKGWDVGDVSKQDSTYQDMLGVFDAGLSFDSVMRSDVSMEFTYGSPELDANHSYEQMMDAGAIAYATGVNMIARDLLDDDMRFAAACGLTLGEYYEKYPEFSRSGEQILEAAQSEYETTWDEFGKTISGMLEANESIREDGDEVKKGEDTITIGDLFGLSADTAQRALDLSVMKITNFLLYSANSPEEKSQRVRQKYGNDAEAYRADVNEVLKGENERLQGVYDMDATKGEKTFDEWKKEHPEAANLRQLEAQMSANLDIFGLGMTPDEIKRSWNIVNTSGIIANTSKLVAEHGSEFEGKVYDFLVSGQNSAATMFATAALGAAGVGTALASFLATGKDYMANAYDRYQATGNADAAFWSSAAEWVVGSQIERMGFEQYMPDGMQSNWANKVARGMHELSSKGFAQIIRDPKSMSKIGKGFIGGLMQSFANGGAEFAEEFSQAFVSAMADNYVYGEKILPSTEQLSEAAKEGVMAFFMAPVFTAASGNTHNFTDIHGDIVSAAEALLLPEHDGAILNDAIDFEATLAAIHSSSETLAEIENSSENAVKQQAAADLQAANAELADAEAELAAAKEEESAAAVALEDANVEMQETGVFTEELGKRMTAAAEAIQKAKEHVAKVNERVKAASQKQAEAQQRHEEAKAKVQAMYNAVMEEAKAKAKQLVTDLFFGGDSEAQQAASQKYLDACERLIDAKNRLRSAKADAEMYARGTPRGDDAHSAYGEALLEVDALTEEVAAAKAEVDAAYAATGEGQMQAQQNADLTAAEEAAALAAEKAAASPSNQNLQAQAELAQAQLNTIRAKQTLDEKRTDIGKRLQSPRSTDREAAVQEWNELQQTANDAAAEADRLQAEVDTTDTQKNLRSAIDNMKQYSNMDLMDENSANHEAAVEAYNELLAAEDAVRIENAQRAMDEAYANMDASKPETVEAYREARKQYNFAIDNGNSMNYTNNGEVYENESKGLYGEDVLGASGFEGEGSGSGAPVRGASAVSLYGDRRAAGRQNARGDRSGRRVDGSVRYESTTGITDVSATPEAYVQALEAGKAARPEDGHQVSPHSVEDVTKHGLRPFLTGDQLAGFAVEPNGNITGVFKNPASKLRRVMDDMMLTAIQEGGDRLDCYAGDLFNTEASASQRVGTLVNKYAKYGFEPVAVVKYNAEYAESDKVQDIVFFIHNGKSAAEIQADLANGDYEQYSPEQLLALKQFGPDDYEAAMEYRDSLIDQRKTDTQDWRSTGSGFGDHRGPAKTGETTVADRNPIEILSDLTSSIRVGYNPGGEMSNAGRRVRRAVLGFYQQRAEAIKTRTSEAGDLAVGLHEFGHAVQARLTGLHANQQLIDALPRGVRNAYDPAEWDGEAIAEFVVDYIFNRDEAVRMAGQQFVQEFEDRLREDRPLYRAIMDASHQTELWNNASTDSKIGSMMKEGNDPRRGQIGNWLQQLARNVETAVADMTAPADLVSRDFRQRALYSLHAKQRADVSLTKFLIDPNGRNIGQSLAERFYRAGVTEADQKEVSRFALARHALDRLAQNKPVFDTHEFPESELRTYVADVQANHPNIVAGADALTSFWNDYMDAWWVGTGMIDQEAVDHMREMYPNYVPTFRVVGKNFNQYGGKSARFQMRGAVEGGSSLEVIDPLNSIVRMTQQMTSTVTQNQLMRDFHREWRRGGLGFIAEDVTQTMRRQRTNTDALQASLDAINDTGTVNPALMDDAYAEMLNLQERWYGTGQNYGANVVSGVDQSGNRFFYRIKDEGLYNLLSGAAGKTGDMGTVLNTVRNFKNMFTKLTTGSNPLFAAKNAMRDIQASVNTGTHSLTYADGMVRWLGALRDVLTNAELYQDWQAMGGGEHTRLDAGIDGRPGASRDLSRALFRGRETRRGEFKTRSTAAENISNVFTWEKWNNAIEAASRYMEYKYGRHDLTTDEGRMEAFMRSQDVTTNFGTRGANKLVQIANQVVPFMNATIQGLNKDVNIIRDALSGDPALRRQAAPKIAKTVMNTALTAMLQYGLLKMFGGNEDDEDYALLNQEMRMGNLIIPIPEGAMEVLGDTIGFDKPYIRIPIAQGPLAQGMYAVALDTVSNVADYSPMEIELWSAVKSILSDSIPDGTVFQGLVDAANNRTWYGGEIESEYMRNYSKGNRYDSDTPEMVIQLANRLNVSPAKLDYLLNQYSGFAGKLVMPLISRDRLNMDESWNLRSAGKNLAYNVLKNYTIDPVSSNNLSSEYSTAKDTIDEIVADGKAGKPMFNVAYSADAEEAYGAAQVLKKEFAALDKEIAALWSEYNDIKASDLDDGDKARQMRAIRRDYIAPLQQEALALYEEYKMQYIDADSLAMQIRSLVPYGIEHPSID